MDSVETWTSTYLSPLLSPASTPSGGRITRERVALRKKKSRSKGVLMEGLPNAGLKELHFSMKPLTLKKKPDSHLFSLGSLPLCFSPFFCISPRQVGESPFERAAFQFTKRSFSIEPSSAHFKARWGWFIKMPTQAPWKILPHASYPIPSP